MGFGNYLYAKIQRVQSMKIIEDVINLTGLDKESEVQNSEKLVPNDLPGFKQNSP